jgi:hypothetical protein
MSSPLLTRTEGCCLDCANNEASFSVHNVPSVLSAARLGDGNFKAEILFEGGGEDGGLLGRAVAPRQVSALCVGRSGVCLGSPPPHTHKPCRGSRRKLGMSKSLCGTPSLKSVVLSCSKPPCYPAYPDFKTQAWDLFKGVAIPL